jgi:hypothetical protein
VGRMGLVHLENLASLDRGGEIELVAIGDRHSPTLAGANARLEQWGTRAASPVPIVPDARGDGRAVRARRLRRRFANRRSRARYVGPGQPRHPRARGKAAGAVGGRSGRVLRGAGR